MMQTKRDTSTAANFLAQLAADDGFRVQQEQRERVRSERMKQLSKISQNLTDDLNRAGVIVNSVWSRIDSLSDRLKALPILHVHLQKDYPDEILEGIARAMAVSEAAPYRATFVSLFRKTPPVSQGFRYGLGLAIANTTVPNNLDETLCLIKDQTLGICRMALLPTIRKKRKQKNIVALIEELKQDPDLGMEVSSWK